MMVFGTVSSLLMDPLMTRLGDEARNASGGSQDMGNTRRAKGEGSVRYDSHRQAWVGTITIDRTRKAAYGKTKGDVLDKLAAFRKDFQAGRVAADSDPTVGDQLEDWYSTLEATGRKASTRSNYRMAIDCLIPAKIKATKLRSLEPSAVRSMVQGLADAGKSPNTQRLTRTVLRRALEVAVREGKVTRNVAALTDGVALNRQPRVPLTTEQTKQLLAYVNEHESIRWQAIYTLTLHTGLRVGELLALRWEDIDLDGGMLSVTGTLDRYNTRTEPKTATGRRTIAISPAVVEALRAQQLEQSYRGKVTPEGYVFTSRFATPMSEATFRDHLHRVCKALGLPPVHWHDLRHSAATIMLANGVPVQLVSKILGHASIQITIDVYNYIPPEATREAADAMDKVLS